MSKFAIMTLRTAESQQVGRGILGRLIRILKDWRSDSLLQPVDTIYLKEDGRVIGYLLPLPHFVANWNDLSPRSRRKKLGRYLKLLEELEIEMVCIPEGWVVLPLEVMQAMEERFMVDPVYQVRVLALVRCVEHLLGIMKDRAYSLKVGIWGADTWAGSLFAKRMAAYINDMVLGGTIEKRLFNLADEVLRETGLACPIAVDEVQCLKDRQFVVIADQCDLNMISSHTIVAYAIQADLKYTEVMSSRQEVFWILSGWVTLPDIVKVDVELNPWEVLGVVQALLLMGEKIGDVSMLDTVKVRGFLSSEGRITYDAFRIRYFRKR